MKNIGRNVAIWVVIVLAVIGMLAAFQPGGSRQAVQKIAYSDFVHDVERHEVRSVTIREQNISGVLTNGTSFETYAPSDPSMVSRLTAAGVEVIAHPPQSDDNPVLRYIAAYLPIILMLGLGFMVFRQMQNGGAGRGAMSFGKSRAKMMVEKKGRVTFADVAGVDEAKEDLVEIVDFLKDPHKFTRLGGRLPKGVLLVGPPGTGKTLLARAVAGEANVPFFSVSGSDFVEMFVGVGASRVRDMFEQGKKNAPCIIFIDEIDAVGRQRGAGLGGGNDEREQTLNQMLVEMDGFDSNEGVILIAATNRPDVLDQALLRPGRFDRQVVVPNPDMLGREKILQVHLKKLPLSADVNPRVIARGTPGFSGAELANLVNEAALFAARQNRKVVSMAQFEEARDKIWMGAERRSAVIEEEEKRMTAYHEAGHAIASVLTPGTTPIHKATIVPRGRTLGMVMSLPDKDPDVISRREAYARIVVAVAGRVAEEIIYGHDAVTSGAASDISQATSTARSMVAQIGMSELIGMVDCTDRSQISGQTGREIDQEVRKLIDQAYGQCKHTLLTHIDALHALAAALVEYETLTGEEVKKVIRGEPLGKEEEEEYSFNGRRPSVPSSGAMSGAASGGEVASQPA